MSSVAPNQYRIVQAHVTRRCNLRCAHCYSSSGPEYGQELHPSVLIDALRDAWDEGYNVVSFSGGEPTLYAPLTRVLDAAKAIGFATTMVTNGLTLTEQRLRSLHGRIDRLAISVDGVPASHDRIRCADGAFQRLADRLPALRDSGIPFGIVFTMTRSNLHELEWVAEFAVSAGAALLQVHPLEEVGRAAQEMRGMQAEEEGYALGYLAARRVRDRYAGRLHVQLDLLDRDLLRASEAQTTSRCESQALSAIASPLVIEENGMVVPLQYGFPRSFALGDLNSSRLSDLAHRWRDTHVGRFRSLLQRCADQLSAPSDLPFVNWYQYVSSAAASEPTQPTALRIRRAVETVSAGQT